MRSDIGVECIPLTPDAATLPL